MASKVLVVIYGATDGTEMVRVTNALLDRGVPVTLHFFGLWADLQRYLDCSGLHRSTLSDKAGRSMILASAPAGVPDPAEADTALTGSTGPARRGALRLLLGRLYYVALRSALSILSATADFAIFKFLKLWRVSRNARDLLERTQPDVVVTPIETVGDNSSILAKVAHDRRIPIVVIPYTIAVNLDEVGERLLEDRRHHVKGPINRLTALFAPRWVNSYRGHKLLRLRPSEIFSRWLLGLTNETPWAGGGLKFAQAIGVESNAMKKLYLKEGYPEAKLHLTGSISDDILAGTMQNKRALRRALDQRLNLDRDKPILLCAIPPDFIDRSTEFDSYRNLLKYWLSTLDELQNFNIVLRLHPSLPAVVVSEFLSDRISLAQDDTATLLAVSDLYVASVSSTIRWAVQCGLPVVNYDVYRFRYSDFSGLPGVLTVETRDAFASILNKLDRDPSYLSTTRDQQICVSADWGTLDGNSATRIVNLINRVADESRRPQESGTAYAR